MGDRLLEGRDFGAGGLVDPDVILELRTELGQGVLDGPGRAVGQAADRGTRHDPHVVGHVQHDIEIFEPPAAGLDSFHRLVEPSGPFATRRALAAALMGEEAAGVVEVVDDAGLVVDHGHGGRTEPETAWFTQTLEVERRVQLAGRQQAHADPAGNSRLGLSGLSRPRRHARRSRRDK